MKQVWASKVLGSGPSETLREVKTTEGHEDIKVLMKGFSACNLSGGIPELADMETGAASLRAKGPHLLCFVS